MDPRSYIPTSRDLPPSGLRRIADGLLNLVFPESCLICSTPVSRMQDCGVCSRCWDGVQLLRIPPPWCPSCGIPIPSLEADTAQLCISCSLDLPAFSGARSYGYYRAELSRLVQELKFGGRRDLVGLLGPLLARTFFDAWLRDDLDLIAAVPLHPARKRERGYNQAELLARALARHVALPFVGSALHRIRATAPQVGLSDPERSKNMRGAFRSEKPGLVKGKRVLLVDDVMTTGSTLQSAAEALMEAGALRVMVLTVARAVPGLE